MSATEVSIESSQIITDDLDAFATEFFGGNKVTEPDAKPEPEDAAQEQKAEVAAEVQSEELTDQDEAEAEAELAAAKPKSKVQERIDELVRQREEIKRESERQLQEVRREFEAKLAAISKPAEVIKQETTNAEPAPDALNPDGSPKYALGEFDPQYIRDLTRFTLESERAVVMQREAEQRKQAEQLTQAMALQQSWNQKVESAKEKYPDLIEKGQTLLGGFANLPQDYATYLSTVLQSMDHGPDVLYYLSSHPDEARTIVNSGAQKATLALGRIEAKFVQAEAEKVVAKPKVTQAPPPPRVGSRGTGGAAQTVAPDTDDLDAFAKVFFAGRR
jgi:hypothetical protein